MVALAGFQSRVLRENLNLPFKKMREEREIILLNLITT
jgi:hypothetical protein